MFTNPHSTSRRGRLARIAAGGTAAVAAGAIALAAPLPALAAEGDGASYGEGQFLSGTLLGTDLANIVEIAGADAVNDGTQATQTSRDPLDVTVLNAVNVGGNVQLDLGDVVQAGAIQQYARAENTGSSMGFSGTVANDGGVGVGEDEMTPGGTTTVDLEALLGERFAKNILQLELELDAIHAEAEAALTGSSGDYTVAGARLVIDSPAVSRLTKKVDRALDEVLSDLDELGADDAEALAIVNRIVKRVDPTLNILGASADADISISTGGLKKAVHRLLQDEYGDSAVSFDLDAGTIVVDLEKIVGSLNNLPPNTELLTDEVVLDVLDEVTDTVATLTDQIIDTVEELLRDATVTVSADVSLDIAQAPLVEEVCTTVERVIQEPVEVEERVKLPLLGWVTRTVTKLVDRTVERVVCEDEKTILDPLKTRLDLDITATIDELISGVGVDATVSAKVLGIPVDVDLDLIIDDLGDLFDDTLFGTGGTIAELRETLNDSVVHPAVTGLLGDGATIQTALTDIVSVKINVQETGTADIDGIGSDVPTFTQTAIRISALGSSVAEIDLAQATVASAGVGGDGGGCVGDDCDPDTETDPDCQVNCGVGGDGGGNGGGGTNASGDPLAFTGSTIGVLIALLLALLAAGAYLVREGYRRRRSDIPTA